jgi:putative oxidoreductase
MAAFVASGQMAVAYLWMHWPPLEGEPTSFWPLANGGEMAVMYCFAFLLLAGMGAGVWSADARRRRAVARTTTATTRAASRGGLLSRFRR